jgi:hypothetical protein
MCSKDTLRRTWPLRSSLQSQQPAAVKLWCARCVVPSPTPHGAPPSCRCRGTDRWRARPLHSTVRPVPAGIASEPSRSYYFARVASISAMRSSRKQRRSEERQRRGATAAGINEEDVGQPRPTQPRLAVAQPPPTATGLPCYRSHHSAVRSALGAEHTTGAAGLSLTCRCYWPDWRLSAPPTATCSVPRQRSTAQRCTRSNANDTRCYWPDWRPSALTVPIPHAHVNPRGDCS